MRELLWMAVGRQRAEWDQMTSLMAQIGNMFRMDAAKVKPEELNPFRDYKPPEYEITVLKKLIDGN